MRTDDPPATNGARFQESQRVELDLREPPTREEAGIADGRGSLLVQRDPGRMLDVTFHLPNGNVLKVPATGVLLATGPGADPAGPVESINVNRPVDDVAAAREAALADAGVLGFDAREVAAFFDGVTAGTAFTRVFERRVGYLHASLDVRHDPVNGAHADLLYTFAWGSAVEASAPAG